MPPRRQEDPFSFDNEIKSPELNRRSRIVWTEETFIDSPGKRSEERTEFISTFITHKKLNWLLFILGAGILILAGWSAYLQIFKGDYYRQMAEGNRIRIRALAAGRGVVYDRNKNLLVKNVPGFSLFIVPSDLPKDLAKRNESIIQLAETIKGDSNLIFERLKSIKPGSLESYQPIMIKENIDYEEAIILKIESADLPGIIVETGSRREYLNQVAHPSFSHILGYLGKISKEEWPQYKQSGYLMTDYVGETGLEATYENVLRGEYGKERVEVDALGKKKKVIAREKPLAGHNLILSIDLGLQQKLEEILKQHLKGLNKDRGAAIALDPRNGEILALVSLPAFDNNVFTKGLLPLDFQTLIQNPNKPLFARAISGEYPSGSTIKPIIAIAALAEGIIDSKTTFQSVGGIQIDKWFFPDWKTGGHGWANVGRALAESINTFFYIIGGGWGNVRGLGVDKITEYARLFGLAEKTAIDLPGESFGFLPSKEWKEIERGERWYIGDTYHLAIGQGDILVTPLQVAVFTSIFANGGVFYQPHLVKKILDSEDRVVKEIKPKIIRKNFINQNHFDTVRQGLRQAVTGGSARSLSDLPLAVAGKTGTAEWSSKAKPHAWFTGWAPYNNPEIVITVLVEEGDDGSAVAVPIAKEALSWWSQNIKNILK